MSALPALLRGLLVSGVLTAATHSPAALAGRQADTAPAAATAPETIRIYLATYGPGAAVWEKFGHNAIWVRDTRTGSTVSYNWGMFSFDEPGFVRRLMRGSMLYWMMPQPAAREAENYVASGRAIRLQELNIAPARARALNEFLQWHARPENAYYEYDYFRDNCSTRVRDAIDRATGGLLAAVLTPRATSHTFRSESLRLTAEAPAVFTGLELGMADAVDRPLTEWQLAFIPMRLADAVATVTVADADRAVPLVLSDTVIFEGSGFGRQQAPDRTLLYLLGGILLGAAFMLSAVLARHGGGARVPFALIGGIAFLLVGFFGLLLVLLWGATGHVVTYRNENLFQVNPLALGLAVLAPLAAFGGARARRAALLLAALLATLSLLGLVVQIFPAFDQYNRHVLALMVPAHLGMLWGLYRLLDGAPSGLGDGAAATRRDPR